MNTRKLLKYIPAAVISFTVMYAGLILYYILKYGVDVPYNDQWDYVVFFDHLARGTLTFRELFALQGDFRQLFPNLIFVGLGSLTKWNVKYEMIVSFVMVCWVSYNIYRLASYTITGSKWLKWLMFFLANLFIFAPSQYENWLFGVQIEYFIPILCITTGMVVAFSNVDKRLKLILCMLLSVVSTYSSVNGLISWFILFPALYTSATNRKFFLKWQVICAWLLVTMIAIEIYFNGYKTPLRNPSPALLFSQPADAFRYFCGVLGNPLRIIHKLNAIINVGAALFSIYVLLIIYIAWHFKDKQLLGKSIVWIMLGIYSVGTAAMLTVGRLGFGIVQSTSPRYISYSLYLIVSIFFLSAIVIQRYASKGHFTFIHKAVIVILIALFLYNWNGKYRDSVFDLKSFHFTIQHGKAGLLFINYIPLQECVNKIYPIEYANKIYPWESKKLKKRARMLDSLGLLRPGLMKSNIVQDFEGNESKQYAYGSFDKLTKVSDTVYSASGMAIIPHTRDAADAVLLSYKNNTGKSSLLTLTNANNLHWEKTFSIAHIAADTITINAWAFDANSGKAYKLKGSYVIVNGQ